VIKMAKLERTYNVPLRKGFQKAPRYRKSKKAVITLKEFIARHMRCSADQIRIGPVLNEKIWERGIKNPPHHVKITLVKDDEGIVKAELFGHKYPEKETEEKKEKEKETKESKEVPKEPIAAEKEEKKAEEKPAKKKTARKPAVKKPAKKAEE